MERQARGSLRLWLEPLAAEAAQSGLEIRTQYLYITEDTEEHRSRPDENHTYTALIRISLPGETDEERIGVLDIELLRVRLGKKAYRGVMNLQAESELKSALAEMLTQVKEKGIEGYLQED